MFLTFKLGGQLLLQDDGGYDGGGYSESPVTDPNAGDTLNTNDGYDPSSGEPVFNPTNPAFALDAGQGVQGADTARGEAPFLPGNDPQAVTIPTDSSNDVTAGALPANESSGYTENTPAVVGPSTKGSSSGGGFDPTDSTGTAASVANALSSTANNIKNALGGTAGKGVTIGGTTIVNPSGGTITKSNGASTLSTALKSILGSVSGNTKQATQTSSSSSLLWLLLIGAGAYLFLRR